MSRIDELIAEHCRDGVELRALSEIAVLVRGNGMPKTDLVDEGVGAIHYGQIYTRYGVWAAQTYSFVDAATSSKLAKVEPGDIIITNTSENLDDVGKAVAWLGSQTIVTGGHATVIKHDQEPKYLAYWFASADFFSQKRKLATGTKVIDVSAKQLATVRIPVPPLEVQREIVRILEQFTQLEAELEAELEARRRQYNHYFRRLLTFMPGEAEELTLGDIGRVAMCKRVFKNETRESGEVPFFKIGTFGGVPDAYISRSLFDRYRKKFAFPRAGDVLISAAGTIGRTVVYSGEDSYFQDSNIVWLDHDGEIVSNGYLKHWYRMVSWSTEGGTIKRLYNSNLLRTKILVPSHSVQKEIVEVLDTFDALINNPSSGLPAELAARRKQYEYYREKLFAFEEAAV